MTEIPLSAAGRLAGLAWALSSDASDSDPPNRPLMPSFKQSRRMRPSQNVRIVGFLMIEHKLQRVQHRPSEVFGGGSASVRRWCSLQMIRRQLSLAIARQAA